MKTICRVEQPYTPEFHHGTMLPEMPILDELAGSLGVLPAEVVGLVGLQHVFGSTATLLHKLAGGGIDPGNVSVLGKPYSANPEVLAYMRETLGFWTHPDTLRQPEAVPNDEVMDKRIEQLLERVRHRARRHGLKPDQRILLIDDGGRAIRLLHSPRFAGIRRHFTCVEQTRCGIRTIAELDLEVPVINVAESWVKLRHESPLIAQSVTEKLLEQLHVVRKRNVPVGSKATVVGYGAIGVAVAEELSLHGFEVAVFDHLPERRRQAEQDGYSVLDTHDEVWPRGGVVVGCTGLPVLDRSDHRRIAAGTLLISASSADVEFRAWQLRPASTNLGRGDETGANHPCFSIYRFERPDGGFYLLNGGFPINFDGGVDTIVPEKIQLTRSLLLIGGHQACRTVSPGLHPLNDKYQQLLVRTYLPWSGVRAA